MDIQKTVIDDYNHSRVLEVIKSTMNNFEKATFENIEVFKKTHVLEMDTIE